MSICVSQTIQKSPEVFESPEMFEKILLCGPLGGDTAQKVAAVLSHACSQHSHPGMHTQIPV